ncbi:MAG: hypothetical protein ABIU06_15665 [Anaerolineales bacterium]
MEDLQTEQTSPYHEYFDAIKEFNEFNVEYTNSVNTIVNVRKMAIQRAIEIHINPVISRVQAFQLGSVIFGFMSLGVLCFSLGVATISTPNSQTVNTVARFGLTTILFLISIGMGLFAILVFAWTTSKIRSLYSNARDAQEKIIDPFD